MNRVRDGLAAGDRPTPAETSLRSGPRAAAPRRSARSSPHPAQTPRAASAPTARRRADGSSASFPSSGNSGPVRFQQPEAQPRKRREPRGDGLVPLDEQRAHREVGAETRHAVLVRHLRDLERHAERLRDRLQRDRRIAHLDALQRIAVRMRALVGGHARRDVADVDLEFLRKRFLDERDLFKRPDRLRVVDQALQGVLALVAPVGVEVIRQLPVRRVRRARVADGGVDRADPRLVLLQHLGLRPRLADFDLHEKIPGFDRRLQFLNGNAVGHQRNARDLRMPVRERRPIRRGNQIVEIRDPVLRRVEPPRREIDAHERVEGEGLAQSRVAGDLLSVGVNVVPDGFEQLDGIGKGLTLELLERPLAHRIHQRVAAALGVPGKHVRIAPEHALRTQPDPALPGRTLEHRDALPDFGHVAAFETKRPHERFAFEVGADGGEGDGTR